MTLKNEKRKEETKFSKMTKKMKCGVYSMLTFIFCAVPSFAGIDNVDAEDLWNTGWELFFLWVGRMGLALGVMGLIFMGLGWKDDDATSITRGQRLVIAGILVFAFCQYFSSVIVIS